jgi:hypothetical protein
MDKSAAERANALTVDVTPAVDRFAVFVAAWRTGRELIESAVHCEIFTVNLPA